MNATYLDIKLDRAEQAVAAALKEVAVARAMADEVFADWHQRATPDSDVSIPIRAEQIARHAGIVLVAAYDAS